MSFQDEIRNKSPVQQADSCVFIVECIDRVIVPVTLFYLVAAPLIFYKTGFESVMFVLGLLFLCKWIGGLHNCTFGYLECKIRGCHRNNGWINHFVSGVYEGGHQLGPEYIGLVASSVLWCV